MAITGSCHCGSTSFEINGEIPRELTRCTCSFCSKTGRLIAYYRPDQFRLTSAPDKLGTYRWNTKQIANHYCPVCGCNILPTARPISGTAWVNARLFDNFF